MEPGRVLGGPARRGDDQDTVAAVGEVAEGSGVPGAGAGAGGGEQEQPGTLEPAADATVVGTELVDDLLVEVVGHSLLSLRRVRR